MVMIYSDYQRASDKVLTSGYYWNLVTIVWKEKVLSINYMNYKWLRGIEEKEEINGQFSCGEKLVIEGSGASQ